MCQSYIFCIKQKKLPKNYTAIEFNEDITQNEYYIFKFYNNKKPDPFKLLLFSSDRIN